MRARDDPGMCVCMYAFIYVCERDYDPDVYASVYVCMYVCVAESA